MMGSYSREINVQDALEYSLKMGFVTCEMKVFLLNRHEATAFFWSGQAYMSFNLLRILNFFYENYWPRLNSSNKCRESVSHGDIKFWFSGNDRTGRHIAISSNLLNQMYNKF